MRTREAIRQAKKDGAEAGKAAASWCFDGNTKDETYRIVLRQIEDGDPALDFNPPNLSGEYSDDPTPHSLAEEYGIDDSTERGQQILDDVCSAWEDAANEAFYFEIERVCRFHVAA